MSRSGYPYVISLSPLLPLSGRWYIYHGSRLALKALGRDERDKVRKRERIAYYKNGNKDMHTRESNKEASIRYGNVCDRWRKYSVIQRHKGESVICGVQVVVGIYIGLVILGFGRGRCGCLRPGVGSTGKWVLDRQGTLPAEGDLSIKGIPRGQPRVQASPYPPNHITPRSRHALPVACQPESYQISPTSPQAPRLLALSPWAEKADMDKDTF